MRKIKLFIMFSITCIFFLSSCGFLENLVGNQNSTEDITNTLEETEGLSVEEQQKHDLYLMAAESGFTGTYQEWLESIKGEAIQISIKGNHIVWKYSGEKEWHELISLNELRGNQGPAGPAGKDGKVPEFRVSDGRLQWKYTNESVWKDLYDIGQTEQTPDEPTVDENEPTNEENKPVVDIKYINVTYVISTNFSENKEEVLDGAIIETEKVQSGILEEPTGLFTKDYECYGWYYYDKYFGFMPFSFEVNYVSSDITLYANVVQYFDMYYVYPDGKIDVKETSSREYISETSYNNHFIEGYFKDSEFTQPLELNSRVVSDVYVKLLNGYQYVTFSTSVSTEKVYSDNNVYVYEVEMDPYTRIYMNAYTPSGNVNVCNIVDNIYGDWCMTGGEKDDEFYLSRYNNNFYNDNRGYRCKYEIIIDFNEKTLTFNNISNTHILETEPINVTVSEALQIINQNGSTNSYQEYIITARIKEITHDINGNMVLTDGYNTIDVYYSFSSNGKTLYEMLESKPVVGNMITVRGTLGVHNNKQQIKNVSILEFYLYYPTLYIRGSMNEWSVYDEYKLNVNTTFEKASITIYLEVGDEFKVADETWEVNIGSDGNEYGLLGVFDDYDYSIKVLYSGTYVITIYNIYDIENIYGEMVLI